MTLPAFEDFLYGACLLDWEAEHERISRYATLFDQAEEVRIVGDGTDLRLSLAGRRMEVDAGHRQHARRRVLRLPGRDVRRGHDRLHRVPGGLAAAATCAASGCASRRAGSSTPRPTPRRSSCSRRSTPTRARAGSASSASAATPASPATCATLYFDEKIDGTVHIALGFGLRRPRRHERVGDPLGHRQGPAPRRPDRAGRPGRPGERRLGRLSAKHARRCAAVELRSAPE